MLIGNESAGVRPVVGSCSFLESFHGRDESYPRIYVKFRPDGLEYPVLGLLDTGAHFCILNRDVAELIGGHLVDKLENVVLRTAHGPLGGDLYRHRIEFFAEEGPDLEIEATMLVAPDWHGPSFLGYSGALDRLRFAIDPERNRFSFAPLGLMDG